MCIGFTLCIFGVIMGISYAVNTARTNALRTVAAQAGYSFEESGTLSREPFGSMRLFHEGRSPTMKNVMREKNLVVFDYSYLKSSSGGYGSGIRSSRSTWTVAVFHLEGGDIPRFKLGPKSEISKFFDQVGYKDIEFQENTNFTDAFLIRGTDDSAIRNHFTPQLRMQLSMIPDWYVEGEGEWLAAYRAQPIVCPLEPGEIVNFIEEAKSVFACFFSGRKLHSW
jgi:hypothetical protein